MSIERLRALEKEMREYANEPVGLPRTPVDALIDGWADRLALIAELGQEVGAVAYFAADPANGEFDRYESLEEARERAEQFLDFADDDAADSGWADDPPQICYGVIFGHCVEESRKPAPTGSEFTEIVNFRLESSTSPAHTSEARDSRLAELFDAASKGFHISETCGPDKKYWRVSKFQTMAELHAYEDAWRAAMTQARDERAKA